MARITSRQNPIVAQFRDAARGAAPDVILLDGTHLVAEAAASGIHLARVLATSQRDETDEVTRLVRALRSRGTEVLDASPEVMAAASPVRSSSPIAALATRPSHATSVFDGPAPLVVIACDVQDPGNLGAIVRVAEAAGATGFIAAGRSADPFGWKALRGSMGSALRLPIMTIATTFDAVEAARASGLAIAATEPRGGESMHGAALTGPLALLIGSEGAGLPPTLIEKADLRLSIPMTPRVDSLNAAVATAVLLYEARRQRTSGAIA